MTIALCIRRNRRKFQNDISIKFKEIQILLDYIASLKLVGYISRRNARQKSFIIYLYKKFIIHVNFVALENKLQKVRKHESCALYTVHSHWMITVLTLCTVYKPIYYNISFVWFNPSIKTFLHRWSTPWSNWQLAFLSSLISWNTLSHTVHTYS